MKDSNADRMLRKYKGFANSVKQMLNQEYKFLGGDKIQDMFIKDLLEEFNRHLKMDGSLMPVRLYGGRHIKMNFQGGIRPSRTPRWFRLFCPSLNQDD